MGERHDAAAREGGGQYIGGVDGRMWRLCARSVGGGGSCEEGGTSTYREKSLKPHWVSLMSPPPMTSDTSAWKPFMRMTRYHFRFAVESFSCRWAREPTAMPCTHPASRINHDDCEKAP